METKVVKMASKTAICESMKKLIAIRTMTADEFIETHGSGTLRKNKRIGFAWKLQYLEERTVFEFGWKFECVARTRVTFGDAITEGDNHAITEAGWHIDRYISRSIFPEDIVETKYIIVEYPDGKKKEGVGIIMRQTSAAFIPCGHLVFAIIAEFDVKNAAWRSAENPF
jgi:hypothetical protein